MRADAVIAVGSTGSSSLAVVASLIAIPLRFACRASARVALARTSRASPQVRTP